jgi:hypothetical protein
VGATAEARQSPANVQFLRFRWIVFATPSPSIA